jgi:hypothetical protein
MPQAGEPHPDRNARFEYINETAAAFLGTGDPAVLPEKAGYEDPDLMYLERLPVFKQGYKP